MMSKQIKIAIATAPVLLFATYIAWLYSDHFIYSRTVLRIPIRFEQGFSFKRQFTVGPAAKYWVVIGYHKEFRMTATNPSPPEEFRTEFDILSRGNVIARGSSDSYAPSERPWSFAKNYVVYFVGHFDAEPGKMYELSLRITDVQPTLGTTNGEARVIVDSGFDRGYPIRNAFIIYFGIGLAVTDVIYILFALIRPGRE